MWKLTPSQFNALPSDDKLYMLGWVRYQDKELDELRSALVDKAAFSPEVFAAVTLARSRNG